MLQNYKKSTKPQQVSWIFRTFINSTDPKGTALQLLDHLIDLAELTWDADALRTMGLALTTLDAMIRLTFTRHHTLQ